MDCEAGREKVVDSFKKYCSACKGKCCMNGELNLFTWERVRLALKTTTYYNDKCRFCGISGCDLEIDRKPLDCISYPVYPKVEHRDDGKNEMTGLMVHRSCPYSEEIAGDDALIRVMRSFWKTELNGISADDICGWFTDENNYWADENVILADLS